MKLRQRPNGIYYADFMADGTRHRLSLKTKDEDQARTALARLRASQIVGVGTGWVKKVRKARATPGSWLRIMHSDMKKRAKIKGFHCLGISSLARLVEETNGHCTVSGVPFDLDDDSTARAPFRPSPDRINSGSGYTFDNTRIVCTAVNIALGAWGDEVFDRIARAYASKLLSQTLVAPQA